MTPFVDVFSLRLLLKLRWRSWNKPNDPDEVHCALKYTTQTAAREVFTSTREAVHRSFHRLGMCASNAAQLHGSAIFVQELTRENGQRFDGPPTVNYLAAALKAVLERGVAPRATT